MKIRKVYLLKDDAFTGAQTKVQDINIIDPIASIDILVEMTNGSAMTEASVVKPHDEFTKIEIVDGADVLESASMEEWQGLNFVEMGRPPFMVLSLEDNAVQREMCHIHFGIGEEDPEHYFNPKSFRNPQLKITNTFTTAAATSWAASGHTITVIANVIEEGAVGSKGFLSTKEMYAFTAVDAAVEVIDMPRDYPYRLLLLQAQKTAKRPDESLEKIKISCDADKYVPVDMDIDHLIMENISQFGIISIPYLKRMKAAADVLYSDLWYRAWATAGGGTTLYATQVLSVTAEKVVIESYGQT